MIKYKVLLKCRICGSQKLKKWADLGTQPLANSLLATSDQPYDTYPLEVFVCEDCTLSQLSVVVDPEKMFTSYLWQAGLSKSWVEHCKWIANTLCNDMIYPESSKIIDIGANDGCLVSYFKEKGFSTLGVEPSQQGTFGAKNFYDYDSIHSLWNIDVAQQVLVDYGIFDIITATNVLAHVDDVHDFLEGVKLVLATGGVFFIEVPYVKNLIKDLRFDTIYHEHLSYFSATSLYQLMNLHALKIVKIEHVPVHGGSLAIWVRHQSFTCGMHESVGYFLDAEQKHNKLELDFQNQLLLSKINLHKQLKNLKGSIAIYGASAKATVFLNYMELSNQTIACAFDDNIDKQYRYIPGTGIEIFPPRFAVDNLILTSWNIQKDLEEKIRSEGFKGEIWVVCHGETACLQLLCLS